LRDASTAVARPVACGGASEFSSPIVEVLVDVMMDLLKMYGIEAAE
jgi:hypothetical protein